MGHVASPSATPLPLDLRELRLHDALALLGHEGLAELPSAQASPLAHLQALIDNLCQISVKDPLTGLSNRRHFNAVLERALDGVARAGTPTLLLLLDIDHFKAINDGHGHPAGDQVLQAVARSIAACIRPQDTVARYGGEEFAIVLPDCQMAYGESVAERIRAAVAALEVTVAPGQTLRLTLSIGGAFAPLWVHSQGTAWAERADVQLYLAKAGGRNRVCIEQEQDTTVSAEEKSLLFGLPPTPADEDNTQENTPAAAAGGST